MIRLRRRFDLARSLDQTIKAETPPVQIRDPKNRLVFTVSGSINATYKIINTRKFIHHFPDVASFEALLNERLAVTACAVMGDALSGKDRSEFAKASLEIGQTVKKLLSAFFDESGVKLLGCTCIPVVLDSAVLDSIEYGMLLKDIDPALLISQILGQAGAGAMGMNPAVNAWIGKVLYPTPSKAPAKDTSLI